MLRVLLAAGAAAAAPGLLNVSNAVPGSFIVQLKPQLGSSAALHGHLQSLSRTEGLLVKRRYSFLANHGFPAYSANLTGKALQALLGHPDVAFIEQDGVASTKCDTEQGNPTNWGISRISAREGWKGSWFPTAGSPNPPYKYDKDAAGKGVYAFVLDTGIECSNADFDEQCLPGKSFVRNEPDDGDYQGHGTHCASILGGTVYGVAKSVFLQPVKVMNMYGSGTYEDIIAGMDWSAGQHPGSPGVLSMSIGGAAATSVNNAVRAVVGSGRTVVAAAGNENQDACQNSPASAPEAFTVGSSDEKDRRADSSNFGPCTNIFAPGVLIQAAYRDSQSWLSGTSMACPAVAGVVAIHLSKDPTLTPKQVQELVVSGATDGVLADVRPDTPNKLLYADC